jgi:hypothetical protein
MRQTASSTRIATNRSTQRPASLTHGRATSALQRVRVRAVAIRSIAAFLLALSAFAFLPRAHAQFFTHPADLGMTYTQQRSKFVGDSASDFFYLRGATVDYGMDLWHGIGPVVSLNGLAVTNLRQQIDIHQASFMGGARYTYSLGHITPTIWNRKGSIFAEAQTGFVVATSGYYPSSANTLSSTDSNITYSFGGGINYNIYHAFELRVMSHYVITDLANGGTNQQKNIQVSAGVNWHFGN